MTPTAFLEHQIPGRTRLKIPSKRGDVEFFESLVRVLSGYAIIEELIANPLTAGLVIRHSSSPEAIFTAAAEQGMFKIQPHETANAASRRHTVGKKPNPVGALNAIALGLSGLGAVQVARGRALGSSTENFWNAYGAIRVLESRGLAAAFAGLGIYQLLRGELLGPASSLFFYALVARQLAAEQSVAAAQTPASR